MAEALTPEQLEIFRQMRDLPGGLWDAGKTVARGAVGQIGAGYAGLYDLMRGKGADAAANRVREVEEGTRRDPETKSGQAILQKIGETIEPVSTALKENVADPVGKVSPLLGAALVAVPEALPGPKGLRVGPKLSGGGAVREAADAARAATRAAEAAPTPAPGLDAARVAELDAERMARNEATVARMRERDANLAAWREQVTSRQRPEGSEPVPGSTLDRQRERARQLAQYRAELEMTEQPANRARVQRDIDRLMAEDTPRVVEALRAGPTQATLPGVEPLTRRQQLSAAEQRKIDALARMSFEDTNRGANFEYNPTTSRWHQSQTEGPDVNRRGERLTSRTGDRPANRIDEGYREFPGVREPHSEHVRLRTRVGDENLQRMLEKDDTLDAARRDLSEARREHGPAIAREDIAERTSSIEQLRAELANTRDPQAAMDIEREIFQAMRGKPLLVGPESDTTVYRAVPSGTPGSAPRSPSYANEAGEVANLPLAFVEPRERRLNAQAARVRQAGEVVEGADELYRQMRGDRLAGGQLPPWMQTLERQNPGRAGRDTGENPSAQTQQAETDWWQNNPDVVKRFGEIPKPPPPPPDPNAFKARTVNAFLRESSQNPAMFEYGPDPKATDLRGIANEMSASAGGRKKTGGSPVEINWTGPGMEPTRGTKRGRLSLEVPELGEISATFGSDGKAHILATEGGDVGALLYQILNNHARKQGYTIEGDSLFNVNKLRVSTNILAEGARQGGKLINPRNMRGTSAGNELPLPTGRTTMPEVWQAEQASARERIRRGAPERVSPERGVTGGDPYAVRFDPKAGFSIHGEAVTGPVDAAINKRIDELSPGLISKHGRGKPDSTGVGAKTIKRNAAYEWLQNATPKEARDVAKNWNKEWGSLFSAVGISLGEVLKAANDAEEREGKI